MPPSHNEQEEFRAGQVDARLTNIEESQQALWKEMKEMRQGIQDIKMTLATHKGFIMAASSAISVAVTVVTSWLFKRQSAG